MEKKVGELEGERNDERSKIDSIMNEIQNATSEERDAIAKMGQEKSEIAGKIPAPLMAHYEKLLATTSRMAVVKACSGVCYGCFMNIPPQLYIELQKTGGLIHCPQCHRILVYEG